MNRIERLCKIIDYCMNKMLDRRNTEDSHVGWYNLYNTLLDKELDKDLNINADELNVSPIMRTTIKRYIEVVKNKEKYGWTYRSRIHQY